MRRVGTAAVAALAWGAANGDRPVKCSETFKACPTTGDDDVCFVRASETASAYRECNTLLEAHFSDFWAKKALINRPGRPGFEAGVAFNDYAIGGATGTCLTALRYIHTNMATSRRCPMPLPPSLPDLKAHDALSIFTIGDWGPTPPSRGCPCRGVFPGDVCRLSMFGHVFRERDACQEGKREDHDEAQQKVADQMAILAQRESPVAVINVGDNFYLGGLSTPANVALGLERGVTPDFTYNVSFRDVYLRNRNDPAAKLHVPWLGMLGNHDYGGSGCLADWQSQIEFTKKDPTKSWTMPFQYYQQRIRAGSFFVDIFVNEANHGDIDIKDDRGICHQLRCAGGVTGDIRACEKRMHTLWDANWAWLQEAMARSKAEGARWTILAGHFPSGYDVDKIVKKANELAPGSSVYVCGHAHVQNTRLRGVVPVMVTGAGGGYMKEGSGDYYGFGTLKITRDTLSITQIDDNGRVRSSHDISHPEAEERIVV